MSTPRPFTPCPYCGKPLRVAQVEAYFALDQPTSISHRMAAYECPCVGTMLMDARQTVGGEFGSVWYQDPSNSQYPPAVRAALRRGVRSNGDDQ